MKESTYNRKLRKIREQNEQSKRLYDLYKEGEKYAIPRKRETSKAIALYLFFLLNAIVIYALVAMWHFSDLSYLGILITDIAAQILVYAIYCLKAYHGKKEQEKNALERDRMDMQMGSVVEEDVVFETPDTNL